MKIDPTGLSAIIKEDFLHEQEAVVSSEQKNSLLQDKSGKQQFDVELVEGDQLEIRKKKEQFDQQIDLAIIA